MWHFVRFVTIMWNGVVFAALATDLLSNGNIHLDAAPARDMSALVVVLFLIGFGCSLALALKAQVNTVRVRPDTLSKSTGRAE